MTQARHVRNSRLRWAPWLVVLAVLTALLVWSGTRTGPWQGGPAPVDGTRSKVYVANETDGTVSVIDATLNRVISTIDLTEGRPDATVRFAPHNLQVSPDGRSVWVTATPASPNEHPDHAAYDDHDGGETAGTEFVIVIDPGTDSIVARVPLGRHLHLAHVVLDSASRYAYVTAGDSDQVIEIDTSSYTETRRFQLSPGREPHGLRYCDGRLYVANIGGGSLAIIEVGSEAVTEVPVGGVAVQAACTGDGHSAFVSLFDTREVVRYESESGTLTHIPLPEESQGPIQIYLSPDKERLYVCDQGVLLGRPPSNLLFEIDVATNSIAATIEVGLGAHGVVVSRDGSRIYVTNITDNTLSIVDADARREIATVPVGNDPNGVAYWYPGGGMP
jgi:YVTN family beta-propeller protein